jgi:MFS family permease
VLITVMKDETQEPSWITALIAMVLVQMATAFMTRVTPTIAPAMARDMQWSDAIIGYLASVTTVGSIAFLVMGAPLLRRLGSVRALQAGLCLSVLGLVFLLPSFWPAAAFGSFLIGLGYGPSSPAGNDVLHRLAPARHRSMIFSIKQAGVPAGGIIAGLALPPIAEAYGWRMSLLFAAVLVVLTIATVQPMRRALDAGRARKQSLAFATFLSPANLLEPLRALRTSSSLTRLAVTGACLAVGQGIWFAYLITFAVSELSYDLRSAGLAFAVMQATGVFGRVLLGGLADRVHSASRLLGYVGIASGLTSLVMVFATPQWPLWAFMALSAVGGVTVSSWNGVQMSEVARRAAHGLVREASSGATIVIFLGYVFGPLAFATLVAATGRFDLGFLVAALAGLVGFWLLRSGIRSSSIAQP